VIVQLFLVPLCVPPSQWSLKYFKYKSVFLRVGFVVRFLFLIALLTSGVVWNFEHIGLEKLSTCDVSFKILGRIYVIFFTFSLSWKESCLFHFILTKAHFLGWCLFSFCFCFRWMACLSSFGVRLLRWPKEVSELTVHCGFVLGQNSDGRWWRKPFSRLQMENRCQKCGVTWTTSSRTCKYPFS
jgi:hypothetical protein